LKKTVLTSVKTSHCRSTPGMDSLTGETRSDCPVLSELPVEKLVSGPRPV